MKVLLIDDHPLVRKGLASVLSLEKDIEIVGEAGNMKDALRAIATHNPDLALVDLRLGNDYGLDIIEKCKNTSCKFIVLTSSSSDNYFKRAEEVGALGYVLKEALPEELLFAVRLVYKGRKYYDPGLMELLMKTSSENDLADDLTPREKEVLIALGQGLSNRDIAEKLYITEYTVKKHVSQILSKLELADRTQAALYAHAKGYVNQIWVNV
jgi:two-component system nitrate/nitrite response regulator NarL